MSLVWLLLCNVGAVHWIKWQFFFNWFEFEHSWKCVCEHICFLFN